MILENDLHRRHAPHRQARASAGLIQLCRALRGEAPGQPARQPSLEIDELKDFDGDVSLHRVGPLKIVKLHACAQLLRFDAISAPPPLAHTVVLQQDGVSVYETGRLRCSLHPGDLLLLKSPPSLQVRHTGSVQQLLLINPFTAADIDELPRRGMWMPSAQGEAARLAARWLHGAISSSDWDEVDGVGDIAWALGRLTADAMFREPLASSSSARHRPTHAQLLDYMDQHLQDTALDLAAIGRAFGYSARSIQRVFTLQGGLSFEQTLLRLRVESAARALGDSAGQQLSLSALARRCGFTSPSQLSVQFRRHLGQSPSEYRRPPVIRALPPTNGHICIASELVMTTRSSPGVKDGRSRFLAQLRRHLHDSQAWRGVSVHAQVEVPVPANEIGQLEPGEIGALRVHRLRASPQVFWYSSPVSPPQIGHMLVLQTAGSSSFEIDGTTLDMRPGSLLLTSTPRQLRVSHLCEVEQYVVLVAPGPLGDLLAPDRALRMRQVDDDLARLFVTWLRSAFTIGGWKQNQLADSIALLLVRLAAHTMKEAGLPSRATPPGQTLGRVCDHPRASLEDPTLSASTVASSLGCSTSTLHRLFRRAEAGSFAGMLWKLRLEACARALAQAQNTSLSITELALRYGFSSPAHFSVRFRAHYGCTPSDYRQRAAASPAQDTRPDSASGA